MNVSEYRQRILAKVNKQRPELDDETKAPLDLALSKDQIGALINTINDNNSTLERKGGAIDLLNAVSNFSPLIGRRLPEIVNALRGQIDSPERELRHRALSTLTAMKDEVAQERLQKEVASSKAEKDKLLPTSTAIAMLGRDEKALSASLLQEVMLNPPNDESLVEAIRHMPSDPSSTDALIALMKDDKVPLVARAMIPEMVSDTDPDAFLSAAQDMLNASGAQHELASWLVKGAATISVPEAAEAIKSTKQMVAKLLDGAPESFQSAADELFDGDGAPDA